MTAADALPEHAALTTGDAVVRASGLGKRIGERKILESIDLAIPAGSFVALLGANGAGKTTLLHIIATLTPPTAGELILFGQPLGRGAGRLRARIGMIAHQPMLYRDLSARENLLFFGRLYGLRQVERRALELLEMVGLADRAGDPAKTFSRGMVQRLAIARALMHDPDLLLADEPFAGLDLPSTRRLEELLTSLHRAGKTVLMTNHDMAQSLGLAQRVVVLRRGRIALDRPTAATDLDAVTAELSR